MSDRELHIATGSSRKTVIWDNITITKDELVKKLASPVITDETYAEYMALPKSDQDEKKDVGGFVGGVLKDRRRKSGHVDTRDLITLDLDNVPTLEFEKLLKAVKDINREAVIYSTRKHSPETPRLRVVFFLNESIPAEKYEPVARMVASKIGMSYCDPSTFQAERLMYWPSCSKDSKFYYKHIEGAEISADEVLFDYGISDEWKNPSNWPIVPGQAVKLKNALKQQDPTTKSGVVGAFCKAFSIQEAMQEFLPGVYDPTDDPNRYTYTGGSTVGGAVVYEGKFLYDNHASSPCNNQLVNAFDMVRLHRFGEADADAVPGTPTVKLPSWKAMLEYAQSNEAVATRLKEEKAIEIKDALMKSPETVPAVAETVEADNMEWVSLLDVDSKGNINPHSINNAKIIIQNDPNLKNIAFDEFTGMLCVTGPVVWDAKATRRQWLNSDDSNLRAYLEAEPYGIKGKDVIEDALTIVSTDRRVNSVKDYLKGLTWDGVERAESIFIDYLGAGDNEYVRAVTRKALTAAVARAYMDRNHPVKFDNMIILVGKQGAGKSRLLTALGKDWFTDSLTTFEGKDAAEIIRGSWIVEVPELVGFNRSDVNTIKQFLSKKSDKYRAAYARRAEDNPRRCVMFGSSNAAEFLRDETGNRRFWPIDINPVFAFKKVNDFKNEVDQVWAEAVQWFEKGETLYLDAKLEEEAMKAQEKHRELDGSEGMIIRYLEMEVPANWDEMDTYDRRIYVLHGTVNGKPYDGETKQLDKVCARAVYKEVLDGRDSLVHQGVSRSINAVLRSYCVDHGWMEVNTNMGIYGKQRGFIRPSCEA